MGFYKGIVCYNKNWPSSREAIGVILDPIDEHFITFEAAHEIRFVAEEVGARILRASPLAFGLAMLESVQQKI